ncbi:MAG: 2-amino-4-hydroxy-6-hydroxymethyldihydropteridine diphosphokinase [Gammaproteobacteria bacterium]|nr:2-amino-4-hydroxy-6-hydroxymethyldihydropteridine diphosphokinase [Gammaproteobacteria bacterium]
MTRVYVSMGSNIERERNTRAGLAALREHYGPLTVSSVYDSKAVGFAGDDFYNLVVGFDTAEDVHAVAHTLERIEHEHGRARGAARFNSRTLDLDLLLYGDLVLHEPGLKLPRPEILRYAFVLWPLAEIAGQWRHPQDGQTYQELWQRFDKGQQKLVRVDFPADLDVAANS